MMRGTGRSVACLLLLCTLGSIHLVSASDLPVVGPLVDTVGQIKQGVLAGIGKTTAVPVTTAPTSSSPVTPTTGATPTTTASPVTAAAGTTATTPTTSAAPSTTTAPLTTAAPATSAASTTKPATTSMAASTTTTAPLTTAAPTTKPATTSTALPTTSSAPPSTVPSTCPTGTKLINKVCVLLCTSATDTPADPCTNAGYPANSGYIDYTNPTPGDVTCEPDTDGVTFYVAYTHSTKIPCSTDADCSLSNANPAGGGVCSTNNKTYCHQGASTSLCPAVGRKLLQA